MKSWKNTRKVYGGGEFMYIIIFYDGIWYSKIVFIFFFFVNFMLDSFLSVI